MSRFSNFVLAVFLIVALAGVSYYAYLSEKPRADLVEADTKLQADYYIDTDKNGVVNYYDYVLFMESYGSLKGDFNYNQYADLNMDEKIGKDDYALLMQYSGFGLGKNLLESLPEDENAKNWKLIGENRITNTIFNITADDFSPFKNIIQITSDEQKFQLINDGEIIVNGEERYVISGWVKTDSPSNLDLQVAVDGYDVGSSQHWYESFHVYPNDKWTFFSREIRIPEEENAMPVKIWARTEIKGKYFVSDIEFRKVDSVFEEIEKNKNLLLNSDFSSGLDRIVSPEAVEFHDVKDSYITTKVDRTFLEKVELETPETYALSAYVKSSSDNPAKVALWIYNGKEGGDYRQPESVEVGIEWQRISYAFNLNEGGTDFFPGIFAPEGSVAIDKVQLEKGELTDYKLNKNTIINLRTGKFANVFFDDEDITIDLTIENGMLDSSKGSYEVYVTDYNSNIIYDDYQSYDLEPSEFARRGIKLGTNNKGHFRVNAVLKDSQGKVIDNYVINVARIERIYEDAFRQSSNFGIHTNQFGYFNLEPDLINQRYEIMRESGAKWTRIFLYWGVVEPVQGEYDWETYDLLMDSAQKNKMHVLLSSADINFPSWSASKNSQEYDEFINEVIKRYSGKITAFEIENEPYLAGKEVSFNSYEDYLNFYSELHNRISGIIRSVAPDMKIVANVGGPGENVDYFEELSRRGLLNNIDAVSLHLYPKPESIAEMNGYEKRISDTLNILSSNGGNRIEIWQSEASRFSDDLDPNYFQYIDIYNRPLSPEHFVANMWIREGVIKRSLGVSKDFQFTFATQDIIYTYYNFFNDRWLGAKPIYPAYNTMISFIDRATPDEKINLNEIVSMHVFKKDDKIVATLWNMADNNHESNLITDSDLSFISQYDFMGNRVGISNSRISFNSYPNYLVFDFGNLNRFKQIVKNSQLCISYKSCNNEERRILDESTTTAIVDKGGSIVTEIADAVSNLQDETQTEHSQPRTSDLSAGTNSQVGEDNNIVTKTNVKQSEEREISGTEIILIGAVALILIIIVIIIIAASRK